MNWYDDYIIFTRNEDNEKEYEVFGYSEDYVGTFQTHDEALIALRKYLQGYKTHHEEKA